MKNCRMIILAALLALALAGFACAEVLATEEAGELSGPGMQEKEDVRLITSNAPAQNNISDERHNMQFSDKRPAGITKLKMFLLMKNA